MTDIEQNQQDYIFLPNLRLPVKKIKLFSVNRQKYVTLWISGKIIF